MKPSRSLNLLAATTLVLLAASADALAQRGRPQPSSNRGSSATQTPTRPSSSSRGASSSPSSSARSSSRSGSSASSRPSSPPPSSRPSAVPSRPSSAPSSRSYSAPPTSSSRGYVAPSSGRSSSSSSSSARPSVAPTTSSRAGSAPDASSSSSSRSSLYEDARRSSSDAGDLSRSRFGSSFAAPRGSDTSRPLAPSSEGSRLIDLGAPDSYRRATPEFSSRLPEPTFPRAWSGSGARDSRATDTRGSYVFGDSGKVREDAPRFRTSSVTHDDILARYRGMTRGNPVATSSGKSDAPTLSGARLRSRALDSSTRVREAKGSSTDDRASGRTRLDSKGRGDSSRGAKRDEATPAELRKRWLNSQEGQRAIARMNARDAQKSQQDEKIESAGRVLADVTARSAGLLTRVASFGAIDGGLVERAGGSQSGRANSGQHGYYDHDNHYDHHHNPYYWMCHWSSYPNYWYPSYGYGYGFHGCWSYCWSWGFNWYWNRCSWYWPYYSWCSSPYGYRYPLAHSYSTVIYQTVYVPEESTSEIAYAPVEESAPAQLAEGEGLEQRDPLLGDQLNRAADYYLVLGDRAFREGRYGATVHYYAKAIEFSPDQGMLYLLLSDALFATGDYSYCASMLRKALELEPGLATNVIDKHQLYSRPSDFDEQLTRLEVFVADHPLDEDSRLVLAVNYLFSGEPQRAVDFLELPLSERTREDPIGALILDTALAVTR